MPKAEPSRRWREKLDERDPLPPRLRRLRELFDQHDGTKTLPLTLSSDEVEAALEAFTLAGRYPYLHAAWEHQCEKNARVREARIRFQKDRSTVEAPERARDAVRQLGWMDSANTTRCHQALYYYHCLRTEREEDYPLVLVDDVDRPEVAPVSRHRLVSGLPLTKMAALQLLADWYGTTPGTMWKWLDAAKKAAKEDLERADKDSSKAHYLRGLVAAGLPSKAEIAILRD